MSGFLVYGICIVGAFVLLAIVIVIADSLGGGSHRRKEVAALKAQRDLAYDAIEKVDAACQEYKEIDHPLASKITPLISEFKKEEWKLRK